MDKAKYFVKKYHCNNSHSINFKIIAIQKSNVGLANRRLAWDVVYWMKVLVVVKVSVFVGAALQYDGVTFSISQ